MRNFFSIIKRKIIKNEDEYGAEEEQDYVELDTSLEEGVSGKILVRTFNLTDFTDVKPIIDALREGRTIIIINIKPLKDKDMIEVKRAINKIKKTVDAVEGDIAGFGDDYVIVTPSIAEVYRAREKPKKKEESEEEFDEDIELV